MVATVFKDSTETSASLQLAGVPRTTPTYNRDHLRRNAPLGMISRLEHLAADLEGRADQSDRSAAQLRSDPDP